MEFQIAQINVPCYNIIINCAKKQTHDKSGCVISLSICKMFCIASDFEGGQISDERTTLDDVVGVTQLYSEILMTLDVHTTSTNVNSVAFKQKRITCH